MASNTEKPLASILVWSDNRADMLSATLDSLLRQTWANTEILVVDNASTDGSRPILDAYAVAYAGRLRCGFRESATRRAFAEHEAAAELNGEYVILASAGTLSTPNRVEASIEAMLTTPNLGGTCCRLRVEESDGRPANDGQPAALNEGDPILRRRLPREGDIVDPDTCTLRTHFLRSHRPSPAFRHAHHLSLWLHVLDTSELLRDNDSWVTRRLPPTAGAPATEPTVGEAYETVFCIAQALRRWKLDEQFRLATPPDSPARRLEEAAAMAQLAMQLIDLDRRFFGRPALGCNEAYFHAQAAVAHEPRCLEAQQALRAVSTCLGDPPPAPGEPSRTLAEWRRLPPATIPETLDDKPPAEIAAYRKWQAKHAPHEVDGEYLGEHIVRLWRQRPSFLILGLPGGRPLAAEQFADQLYPAARLLGTNPEQALEGILGEADADPTADGKWLLLLPENCRPDPMALLQIGEAINRDPQALAWYADDELLDAGSGQALPRFKPDTDPLLLLGSNYLGALAVRCDVAMRYGKTAPDNATPYALALEILADHGRKALGHVAEVLFTLDAAAIRQNAEAEILALRRHLDWRGSSIDVLPGPVAGTRRLRHREPTSAATVSLVVLPSADDGDARCERAASAYPGLEIIHFTPQADAAAGKAIACRPGDNLADLCNRAARAATGEFLLFVGGDSRPATADWLAPALALAGQGGYGGVGVAGLNPDGHHYWGCGTVLGVGGGFDSLHGTTAGPASAGHLGRAALAHEVSAVALDGMLTPRDVFLSLGGFDAQWQMPEAIATDYCLRLRQADRQIAWTPEAVLERRVPDLVWPEPPLETQIALRDRFITRWLPQLAADPYWNRHLALTSPQPEAEPDLVFRWNPDYRDRLRVLALPMPASGQAAYRVTEPLAALDAAGLVQAQFACEPAPGAERAPTPVELERLAPDTLYLQAAFDDVRFHGLRSAARFNPGIFRIFSLDDRISDMPSYNASSKALPRDVVLRRMAEALRCCNRLVVSTEPLAELYGNQIDDIVVVPNRLEKARWCHLQPPAGGGTRPRVGWAGALQHAGDLAMIREVVETLASEVDWIFFGMMPAGCEPYVKEFHGTVHLNDYPAKLASLGLDLAVAPLEVNLFNESKSNLRLLEYGIFGWPVVCTDIYPFRANDAPVCRVPNDAARWVSAIREHLADRDALRERGRELQAWVRRHYLLEDHLDDWLQALHPA